MGKRKLVTVILLTLVSAVMLLCAVFFTACAGPAPEDGSHNTEQGGENESETNPDGDSEEPGQDPEAGENEGPQEIAVFSVSLNKLELTLEEGEEYALIATISPANATDKSITWTSSKSSVATVTDGKVTAKEAGAATITARTGNGKTAVCTVIVEEPAPEVIEVESVSLDQTSLTLEIGESETLTATVLPSNATDKSVTWMSSAPSVANVANGKVTAIGGGTADITVTTNNGKTATCFVTVTDPYADFAFTPSGNGYALTGYSGTDTEVTVPAEYNGKAVTTIGAGAFYDCSSITKITLPDTIKEIGLQAFGYCTSLQTIDIPSCTRVLDSVFTGCTSLQEVTLPEGVISIGMNLFINCNALRKVTILSGSVGRYTFAGCADLHEIVIGKNVTSVAEGAFKDCTSLKYLTLPHVEVNTSFNEYYFGLSTQKYTYYGAGIDDLYADKYTGHQVGNITFQLPASDANWYSYVSIMPVGSVNYIYDEKPVTVLSWQNCFDVAAGISYRVPKSWTANYYYSPNSSLLLLNITDQLISRYDTVFENCSCAINITQKYPVTSVSISGATEEYVDEFSLDQYFLVVKHSDGFTEWIPVADYVSDFDEESFLTPGIHTFYAAYDGQSYEFSVSLKLHTFDDAVLEDATVVADGSPKNLEVAGIPEDTEIIWQNNGQTEPGEYLVTATLKKPYYEDKTLTAYLYIRQAQYKITYVLGIDEAENSKNPAFYNFGEGITLSAPSREAWEFLGWYADADFTEKATSVSAEDYGDKIFYANWRSIFTYSGGEITGLTAYGKTAHDSGTLTSIEIPSMIKGQKITSIGSSAFEGYSKLKSIIISDSITSIGNSAFACCNGLTSITIPEGVTSIGESAFKDCSNIEEIIHNAISVQEVSSSSPIFENAGQSENGITVIFGESVKTIPANLLQANSAVKNVAFGNSIENIGDHAFYYCSGLTSITIPDSVTSIGNYAFSGCNNLSSVTIGEGMTSIGDGTFRDCSSLSNVTIGNNVTSIGVSAFQLCSSLKSITIPDGVKSIGSDAFSSCSGLTSVSIPDSVTTIGSGAFSNCDKLTSVYIKNLAAWCTILFSNSNSNPLNYAYNLYLNGKLVTELTISDGVRSIGDYAFYGYSSLKSIIIPNNVTSIGNSAFRNCSNLTSLTIGNSVTSIGNYAFRDCSSLTSIHYNAEAVADLTSSSNIFYNAGIDGEGITVIFGDAVEKIPAYLFYVASSSYRPNIIDVTIPNNVTSIGDSAFENCSSLTSIIIPDGVTSIGESAFEDCSNLTSVEIPDSVTSIESSTFYDCSSLTSVTIPDSVTSIGDHAFHGCSGLTSVIISDRATSIGDSAFA